MTSTARLAQILWEQVCGEEKCAGRMQIIVKSPYLSTEDREDLHQLIADEGKHARWLRACARRYGPRKAFVESTLITTIREHQTFIRDPCPERLIATVYIPERYSIVTLSNAATLFHQAGDTETAGILEQIVLDEHRHAKVSYRILRNLMKHPIVGQPVTVFYRKKIAQHFRKDHFKSVASKERDVEAG